MLFFFFFNFDILAYFYSAVTQHGNLHPAGWPILFCGPIQEPCVSHSQHRKNRERFEKNVGEWTGSVEISKEEKSLAVSVPCIAIYWPTPGFKGRTFKLCVLARWDFNFCVRSSPLRVTNKQSFKDHHHHHNNDSEWWSKYFKHFISKWTQSAAGQEASLSLLLVDVAS